MIILNLNQCQCETEVCVPWQTDLFGDLTEDIIPEFESRAIDRGHNPGNTQYVMCVMPT